MTPTRPPVLMALLGVAGVLSYLLALAAYTWVPALPAFAPVTLGLLAVAELAMARVVADRVRGRRHPGARVLHPLQIARAAALAQASSTAGAILLGLYAGQLAYALPRREVLVVAERGALVAGMSALSCGVLIGAALLLERACRVPDRPSA